MPVWVDGKTVKGYKVEQFADVFSRVLGVRGVRGVRSESHGQTDLTPLTPLTPTTPRLGEPGYAMVIDAAFVAGHITEDELRMQQRLSSFVYRRRAEQATEAAA